MRKDTVLPEMERASGAPCVAGFDNTATECLIQPFHYATQPDLALVGQRAAEIAVREIDGEVATPVSLMLPAPLVRRTATAILPVDGRDQTGATADASST